MQATLVQQRPLGVRARGARLVVNASGNGASQLKEGAKIKVTAPVTVYHVGKFKQGLNLEGREGVVLSDVTQYKGEVLSANLPWKIQLMVDGPDGKPVKVMAHMEEDELEVLA